MHDALRNVPVCRTGVIKPGSRAERELPPGFEPSVGCGAPQPDIKRDGLKLYAEYPTSAEEIVDRKRSIPTKTVLRLFLAMTDDAIRILGFNPVYTRPSSMIIEYLPVPPPCLRPSVVQDGNSRGIDDITRKLADVVKANEMLRRQERDGAPPHVLQNLHDVLQFHIATMVDNDPNSNYPLATSSGRAIKGIQQRLKGK